MAVGVIDGSSEVVFRTLMSLGTSRAEWDFCFYRGSVVEHLDGHTDIIHMQLYNHWLPWAMRRRDFLLRRYWRREDDGTYVILYHSVFHKRCPPQDGYVRACLKSGGYLITPMHQGKECVIKHMLAVDWRFWKSYVKKAAAKSITIRMLGKVAALREFFRAKSGILSHDYLSGDIGVPENEKEQIKTQQVSFERIQNNETEDTLTTFRQQSTRSSLMALSDAADEFFDVPELSDEYDEGLENDWQTSRSPDFNYVEAYQPKISSTANFVKKLQGLAVQKKGYMDLQEISREESVLFSYGSTLPKDSTFNMPCSWSTADPSLFLVRGDNYLVDNLKVKAKGTLMQMVGADWLRSDKREDDLASRYGSIVQVPGASTYNLALYYMLKTPLEQTPLLKRFVNEDDAFRNSRFKLIPYISKGSWIVKQSVGKKSCLVGKALEVNYFRGKNYLEMWARQRWQGGVVSLVLGYLNNLFIEMAFLIQGNNAEELPEFLLGTCRLNYLDAPKSVCTDSIRMS